MFKKERCSYLHLSPAAWPAGTFWSSSFPVVSGILCYSYMLPEHQLLFPKTWISAFLYLFCKMGKIVLLTYKPIYIPYLCSYTCRTEVKWKPNIWSFPVLDLQMLKLILLSSAWVLLINSALWRFSHLNCRILAV